MGSQNKMKMRLFAFLFLAAAVACSPKPQAGGPSGGAPSPGASSSALPPITVRSHGNAREPVRSIYQQGNRKIYELVANSTESTMPSKNQFRGVFLKTHITFYLPDGSTLVGQAPVTVVDRSAQTVTMQNGVHGRTTDGVVLTCNQLVYSQATGQLHGTGNVHIVKSSEGLSMTGGSFTSDLKLTQVHMQ